MKRILLVVSALLCTAALYSQDKVIQSVIDLGRTDNRTMQHDDFLANRIGGRIIGSHALQDAEAWAADQFRSWGLDVIIQEAGEINVGFNRGPWSGRLLSEDGMFLHFGTPSYTAGTSGPQRGHVVMEPHSRQEFERIKGKLKGAWVLIDGKSNGMALDWSSSADSLRNEAIAKNEEIDRQNMEIRRYNYEHRDSPKEMVPYVKMPALFYRQMVEAGVLGFVQAADLPLQIMYDRKNCYKITMDNLPEVCDIRLDKNQYDVIARKVMDRQEVLLEFDIRNHFFKGPVKYHNVIGVIKGSKYPDEYVMMGGHLDSYDVGTGAVDDGNGASLTLEAARLLAASGAKPKRTMLFCLWTGEEFGLLGSRYFVENKTVDLGRISNYFNRDGGPTAATSITVPPAMYDDFVKVCKPIMNYDERMPFTVNRRQGDPRPVPKSAGGSDHAYFAMNGVPTLSFTETDPLGYDFSYMEIWHTENDIYNRVIPEYMNYSSVITAVVAYGIANLDHLLSREGLYAK